MKRKWRGKGERFTLYISSFSLYFLPLYPFFSACDQGRMAETCYAEDQTWDLRFCFAKKVWENKRSIMTIHSPSYIKDYLISYTLWENNSGSNLLRQSSTSWAGLALRSCFVFWIWFRSGWGGVWIHLPLTRSSIFIHFGGTVFSIVLVFKIGYPLWKGVSPILRDSIQT